MAVDLAGQHRPGGGFGVEGVALTGRAAQASVGSIHFRDAMPFAADRSSQARPIAAGALDAKRLGPAPGVGPRDQSSIPTRIGGHRVVAQADPLAVYRHRDMDMLARIDTDNYGADLGRVGGWLVCSTGSLLGSGGRTRRGGQDCDGP